MLHQVTDYMDEVQEVTVFLECLWDFIKRPETLKTVMTWISHNVQPSTFSPGFMTKLEQRGLRFIAAAASSLFACLLSLRCVNVGIYHVH